LTDKFKYISILISLFIVTYKVQWISIYSFI